MKGVSQSFEAASVRPAARNVNSFSAPSEWHLPVIGLCVFVGYYLGAKIGFALTFQPHPVSVLWPPNSILTAALLLTPPRVWWFVLLSALPAHWLVQFQSQVPPTMILCWFVSNSCEALIGAGLTRYFIGGPVMFNRLRNVSFFCLCVVFLGPFLSSFLDAGFVRWNGWGRATYWEIWRIRFPSNVLAALTVTPLMVTWATSGIRSLRKTLRSRYLEVSLLLFGLLSISFAVLYKLGPGTNSALLYLVLPFLLWAAIQFGSCGASTALGIVTFSAIWSATHGHGPFAGESPEQNALTIQVFLIVLAAPLIVLAAVIEERAKGDTELRESEERMSLAAQAANLGMWEWDSNTDEVWSTTARRAVFGWPTSGKITLKDLISVVHFDDRDRLQQALRDATENSKDYESEFRVVLPDGSVRWMIARGRCVRGADGKAVGLRGISMDVTAQKQAQDLFRLATEASPSGVVVVDDRGRIVLVNSHTEKLFGYEREELVGKPIEMLVPERFASYHPAHRAKFFAAPAARAMGAGRELFGRRKDDSEFPVEIGLSPIQTPEGKLVLAAVVDISARKLAEAEALQHREELGHLSRVAAMGELAASIAHELNQPLSGITSNASAGQRFIDRGDVDLRELHDLLGDIMADGRRAGDVIRDVQSMVRKGVSARQAVNLNDLVIKVARMVNPNAMLQSCQLETLLEPNLPEIEANPIQLQQVLLNLVINAFDAMHDMPARHRKVVIATERNSDGAICASVRDYGVGIPAEALERVFEQFFTTKPKGLGIGLAIVRSIVQSHGGTIVAENAGGGGARFYFTLPASAKTSAV